MPRGWQAKLGDTLRTESLVSQTNIRQRQPLEGQSGTPERPSSRQDLSPLQPAPDDLVWPPEPDSLNAIEVVPLERISTRETAPDKQPQLDRAPDVVAPITEPGRELAPETHRFDDLQDLDLDTLFAPPAAMAKPPAIRDGSAASPPAGARPATSPPGHGWRPAASTPSERDIAQQPPTTKPGKTTRSDHRSAGNDLPDHVPSAVLAQPEDVGPELLLVPPPGQGPQAGTPPSIHIKWDERLDDDVPAVPLSGIARGRELARTRRAAAAAGGAAAGNATPAATSAPSAPAVHPSANTQRHREMPGGPSAVSLDRGFATAPARTTTSRRLKVITAAVLLSAVVIGGLWWRDVPWDALQSRVTELARNSWNGSATPPEAPLRPAGPAEGAAVPSTSATGTTTGGQVSETSPPATEPAPTVTNPLAEGRATAAAPTSRDVLPGATDAPDTSPRIPVPPPVRVEVAASTPRNATPAAIERVPELTSRPAASTRSAEIASRDVAPARPPADLPGEMRPEVPRDVPAEPPARMPLPPPTDPPPTDAVSNPSAARAATPAAVTPVPASPASAAPAPRNEVSPARNAESDVRDALASYRSAYANLDAAAAQRIWPTVDERALARAFSGLKSQQIRFDRCDVQVGNGAATARCEGAATFVPRVGRQEPQTQQRRWSFVLRESSDGWRIERAETSR